MGKSETELTDLILEAFKDMGKGDNKETKECERKVLLQEIYIAKAIGLNCVLKVLETLAEREIT